MSTRAYRCRPLDRNVSILRSKRSISGPGARPSAVRRMTRSVIRRIVGRAGNGTSSGQARTASSVSSRIASKNARIRSPFKGGTRTRRCRACGASSSTSTECRPTVAVNSVLASPEWSTSGSPRKTSRTASGSDSITNRPLPATSSVKASPYRRWHASSSRSGSPANRRSCHQAGDLGPGGRACAGGEAAGVWDIGRTPGRSLFPSPAKRASGRGPNRPIPGPRGLGRFLSRLATLLANLHRILTQLVVIIVCLGVAFRDVWLISVDWSCGPWGVPTRPFQTSSSFNTTNRTSVRRRHLYRTFSRNRNIRLVRSTWLLVRTRSPSAGAEREKRGRN